MKLKISTRGSQDHTILQKMIDDNKHKTDELEYDDTVSKKKARMYLHELERILDVS